MMAFDAWNEGCPMLCVYDAAVKSFQVTNLPSRGTQTAEVEVALVRWKKNPFRHR